MASSGGVDQARACDLRIFINYRRDDAPMAAGRLSDELTRHFGDDHIFMDVDKIEPGVDFKQAINSAVGACDVFIAVIGKEWLATCDPRGRRRLDAPEDYVRLEIEAALKRGVRVIPALVEGALMPGSEDLPPALVELATRNAVQLGDGMRWRYDVEGLIRALERIKSATSAEPASEPGARVPARRGGTATSASTGRRPGWLWRRPWLLATAGAVVLAAAAVTGLLVTRGSGGAPSGAGGMGGTMMKPGAFPDAIEDELLLAHIPEGIRRGCHRATPLASGVFLRTVRCSQGGGSVTYSRAHSAPALAAFFQQKVDAAGLKYPTKSSCRGGGPAADEWQREGTQLHVERRSRQAEGRVLCYRAGSSALMAWIDGPTKIFAQATRPAGDSSSLYSWWRTAAGPETGLGMSEGMESRTWPYPDAIEKDLLLDHVPPMIRKTCKRSSDFVKNVFLRAVECSQGVPGTKVSYMYAHSAIALREYSGGQISAAGLRLPTSARCENASTAADYWFLRDDIVHVERPGHERSGRVLCWTAAGRERIEWTDNSTGIYAAASRPQNQRKAFYAWWQNRAGPGALEMTGMMGG